MILYQTHEGHELMDSLTFSLVVIPLFLLLVFEILVHKQHL